MRCSKKNVFAQRANFNIRGGEQKNGTTLDVWV